MGGGRRNAVSQGGVEQGMYDKTGQVNNVAFAWFSLFVKQVLTQAINDSNQW